MTSKTVEQLGTNQIVFPKLGIDIDLNPTAFTIGSLEVKWYGIIITLGVVLAFIYALKNLRRYGLEVNRFMDAFIGGLIGGIIGARVYFVVMQWDLYKDDWKEIFNFRGGGLAIYGGIIGALIVGCTVAKLRKLRILPVLDIAGIGMLLGQGIGRWGNFFNQEAFGSNTDSIFGMSGGTIQSWIQNYYPNTTFYENFGIAMDPDTPVHPCFLYESIWCLLGFVLLAVFAKKIRRYDGQIFLIYIGWYGLGRAFIESLRTDSLVIGNVRISQLVAILCVAASVILQVVIGLKVKRMGADYQMYCDTEESKQLLYEAESEKTTKTENKSAEVTEEQMQSTETEGNETSEDIREEETKSKEEE